MYQLIRPGLFMLDAEVAHAMALSALHVLPAGIFSKPKARVVHAMGLTFSHPIGLAAGLDKNGEHIDALAKLGFAFIEVGTVTPRPQTGNPKPRLFRVPEVEGVINRMGFNNQGVDALVANVVKAQYAGILGINIGKNKDTPLNQAVDDYVYCLRKVYAHAGYVTVNISSPNTPDLRQLQHRDYFNHFIKTLRDERLSLADLHQRYVPLVVKVSPDETDETLQSMAEIMLSCGIDGIIASNTTAARDKVLPCPHGAEVGGLSGAPLRAQSTHCLRVLKRAVGNDLILIAAGGIDTPAAMEEKREAGATLLQIYTGLIYQGPRLVNTLVDALL